MAIQRVTMATVKAGEVVFWYEYDDVAMEVTTVGYEGTRSAFIDYKTKQGNIVRVNLSAGFKSLNIPRNSRPIVTEVVKNGKTRLDGIDFSMGIN